MKKLARCRKLRMWTLSSFAIAWRAVAASHQLTASSQSVVDRSAVGNVAASRRSRRSVCLFAWKTQAMRSCAASSKRAAATASAQERAAKNRPNAAAATAAARSLVRPTCHVCLDAWDVSSTRSASFYAARSTRTFMSRSRKQNLMHISLCKPENIYIEKLCVGGARWMLCATHLRQFCCSAFLCGISFGFR